MSSYQLKGNECLTSPFCRVESRPHKNKVNKGPRTHLLKSQRYISIPVSFSENDANCIPKLDDSCSFLDIPNSSPHTHLEYEAINNNLQFYDLLYQQQSSNTADDQTTAKMTEYTKEDAPAVALQEARKRRSKKDRHSKINTMRGPRDRRMRLSLEVATKFYKLQDLLGFDKPSKTVDWLLKSSRTAIAKFEGGRGLDSLIKSSNSESCEEVMSSGVDNFYGSLANLSGTITIEKGLELETTLLMSAKKKKDKKIKATVARESRIKARMRARERTSQKKRLSERTDHQIKLTSSCNEDSVFRAAHESVTSAGELNYEHNQAGILNPHCLAEFQYGMPWEAIHMHSLI